MNNEVNLNCDGGVFNLCLENGVGSISSNLHYSHEEWLEEFGDDATDDDPQDVQSYNQYEGAIHGLESFLLALALAGVDVSDDRIVGALDTALNAIGNNL